MVDTILVIVTVISLLCAAIMGVVVWRVLHLEQKRSAARVDALVDAADEAETNGARGPALREPQGRPEQGRGAGPGTRVPHGSNERHVSPWASTENNERETESGRGATARPGSRIPDPGSRGSGQPQEPAAALWTDLVVERSARAVPGHADDGLAAAHLFRPDEAPEGNGRRLIAGFALAAMFLIAAGAVIVSVSSRGGTEAETAAVPPPLELLALEHARTEGQLAIRGVVRNPVARGETKDLVAVVFLYDRSGGYLGTLKHPVVETVLLPGAETPFEVSLSDRLPVARYRVTFHVGRSPVPHLDRRLPSRVEQSVPERGKAAAPKAAALSAAAVR